jgi:catechol 2,3-dioxygenase-like lactoylglutathione lyase family enzyme
VAALSTVALPQTATLAVRRLNCFEISVTDVDRSVRFYQGLFGMPVQARSSGRICLRIGDGPHFLAIRETVAGESPAIRHIGYALDSFEPERTLGALERAGFERIPAPPLNGDGIDYAMKSWLRSRGNAREVYFADQRGLVVQLSGLGYCGGTGMLGEECGRLEEPESAGLMQLSDINHFTVFVNDGAEANHYYQSLFGLRVQAYQGPQAPVTGIGDGFQFVMYAGPARSQSVPANIHHACFSMARFDVDRVLEALTDYGLTARDETVTGPLMHYVSLRMPERGGAPGGTPELYFTDPDGLLMQLQDISYCGGGGYLGSECLP